MTSPVVVITGASSGIGLALAEHYAQRGARVALLARRLDKLEETARRLGPSALPVRCDVSVEGDVERAIEATLGAFGQLDVVIANAGVGNQGRVQTLSVDDYRRVFETNVFGVIRTVKAAIEPLRTTRGRLAIIGSVNGYVATPAGSPYVASKFAVRGFAEAIAFDLAPEGISVTHVAPGFVESEIRLVGKDGAVREGAKDPIPRFLVMRSAVAAAQIAEAIERRRPEVVITGHGKAATLLQRLTPGVVRALVGLGAKRMPELG